MDESLVGMTGKRVVHPPTVIPTERPPCHSDRAPTLSFRPSGASGGISPTQPRPSPHRVQRFKLCPLAMGRRAMSRPRAPGQSPSSPLYFSFSASFLAILLCFPFALSLRSSRFLRFNCVLVFRTQLGPGSFAHAGRCATSSLRLARPMA